MEITAPKISVIVPVYNVEQYLPKCIESILNQTFSDFELLLIDDCSSDNSREICKKNELLDLRIRALFNNENRGVSFTRNKGLKEVKGKYVTFIDSDDWVDKTYLSDFFKQSILKHSISIQGIFYEFKNQKKQTLFSYNNESYVVNSLNNGVVDNELFHNGCPVAKLFDMQIITDNNIFFNEYISLNEDHLFVLEYYKYVDNINLLSSMNYHYWFDCFELSLTKTNHGFTELMKVSQGFFDVLPELIKRYNITDHRYLCKLYTSCGINQMFKAMINSYYSKNIELPFSLRYIRFIELNKYISTYYFPKESSLKVLKYFVLNYNNSINNLIFCTLANLLYYRKKMTRLVKSILNLF